MFVLIWSLSTYPWTLPIQDVNQASFTHSYQVFLPLPAHLTPATTTFLQADTQSSPLHMPTPPQSTPPHHLSHALNPQKTVQIYTALPILQRHPAHPSHHHLFGPLLTMQICFLHHPGSSPICQCTLDTSLVYLSLYAVWCTPGCQDRR